MNILLINSHNVGGVEYYRAFKPNHVLSKRYSEFKFTSFNGFPVVEMTGKQNDKEIVINDDWLKQYQLIIFVRSIGNNLDEHEKIVFKLKQLGIPFALDLDDFWRLDAKHLLYRQYKENKTSELIERSIKASKFITTTTPYLYNEIVKINKNCFIIENGIDFEDKSWQADSSQADKLRFGLMLGTTHLNDLLLIKDALHLCLDRLNKAQVVHAGFYYKQGENSMSMVYESIITDNYKYIRHINGYKHYLLSNKNIYELDKDKAYRREPVTHVDDWGYTYNKIDVSVVPLVANHFNSCKSELKLIEAGAKRKTAVVSYVRPYDLIATDRNSYIVDNKTTFYLQMKRAVENRHEVIDKSLQLYEDVKEKYNLYNLAEKRKHVYELFK